MICKCGDYLSFGFGRIIEHLEAALSYEKGRKGSYHDRIVLKDVFGFAEHQEKATCGLGYKLTLKKTVDDHVVWHAGVARVDAAAMHNAKEVFGKRVESNGINQ